MSEPAAPTLADGVRRGLAWSTINNLVLRAGSLVLGIALARLLAPAQFGVYAIALTVQTVLMTLADLGMSVDLVRAKHPERRAPTVATLSLASGLLLALLMVLTAGPLAAALGTPQAAGVIAVLALTLVVGSAGVVPYAKLQREFRQRSLFACSLTDFFVGTSVTLGLIALGMGPMALAIGRVAASFAGTTQQFVLAHVRPRFGFDRTIAREALGLGLPLAGANLLSWALLNIDNVAIARVAGVTALGLYVLAFNVSSWPMNAIGQAIRAVSLAGFAQVSDGERHGSLVKAVAASWAAALPVGVLLAALASPLIVLLYGSRWSESATVLAALGMFGALRVVLDLMATYLIAHGAARHVLYVQIAWFLALIPAVIVGARWQGIAGAGWAHLAVSLAVVLPAYGVALARAGSGPGPLLRVLWPPVAAVAPAGLLAHFVAGSIDSPFIALVLGGLVGLGTYALLVHRWLLATLRDGSEDEGRAPAPLLEKQPPLEAAA